MRFFLSAFSPLLSQWIWYQSTIAHLLPRYCRSAGSATLVLTKCFTSCFTPRLYIRLASFLFPAFFFVSLGQVFWVCPPPPSRISCKITTQMTTLQLISEWSPLSAFFYFTRALNRPRQKAGTITDISLILLPVYALQVSTKLQPRCRILIPVFSSCILTSVVSLIDLAFIVPSQGQVASAITLVIKVGLKALFTNMTDDIRVVRYISCCLQPPNNSPAVLSEAKEWAHRAVSASSGSNTATNSCSCVPKSWVFQLRRSTLLRPTTTRYSWPFARWFFLCSDRVPGTVIWLAIALEPEERRCLEHSWYLLRLSPLLDLWKLYRKKKLSNHYFTNYRTFQTIQLGQRDISSKQACPAFIFILARF